MPDEESSSFLGGHHLSRERGHDRKRGKIALNDEEGESAGTNDKHLNETSTLRSSTVTPPITKDQPTQASTTESKSEKSESKKRGEIAETRGEIAETREISPTTGSTLSAAPKNSLLGSTIAPVLTTSSASQVKPSRSDSLKKSLLALEGDGSAKVSSC